MTDPTDPTAPADPPAPLEPPVPPAPPGPPEPGTVTLDARSMRGIAHPLRTRLLGLLRADGASTATKLAQRLGLSSAATSYHLRQLAAYGFVAEDESRGTTRERWWRSVHRTTHYDETAVRAMADEEERAEAEALSAEYLRSVVTINTEGTYAYLDHMHELPDAWLRASMLSDTLLLLTPDETARMMGEIGAVVDRYRRADDPGDDVPPGTRQVHVGYQVYPRWAPGLPGIRPDSAYEPSRESPPA